MLLLVCTNDIPGGAPSHRSLCPGETGFNFMKLAVPLTVWYCGDAQLFKVFFVILYRSRVQSLSPTFMLEITHAISHILCCFVFPEIAYRIRLFANES